MQQPPCSLGLLALATPLSSMLICLVCILFARCNLQFKGGSQSPGIPLGCQWPLHSGSSLHRPHQGCCCGDVREQHCDHQRYVCLLVTHLVAHKLSVLLGKMDPNGFQQSKLDEMAKEKVSNHSCFMVCFVLIFFNQTPAELAIITILMTIQLSMAAVVAPFVLASSIFVPPKVEAAW